MHTEPSQYGETLLQLAGHHLQRFLRQESGMGGPGESSDCGQHDTRKFSGLSFAQSTFYFNFEDLFNQVHL
jgi:hypothetical protein